MSIFQRQQPVEPIPTYDVGMNRPVQQPDPGSQYSDPLMAAQLNRMYEGNAESVGVAMITVDNRHMIQEFRARLRGFSVRRRINMETGEEIGDETVKFGEPLMSEDGVNHICGLMESALSKNIMLSNIPLKDHKHILLICRVFWRTVSLQIAVNSEKWLVDRSRRDSLPMEMSLLLYTNFMRAYDDGERRKLYPGQKHITTTMINPAQMMPDKRSLINF